MGSKKLDYQGRAFSDSDLQELPLQDVSYPYEEVNFSQNSLSAEGLRKVLELCSRCDNLRVLKLYKNDIGNEGAQALARFVRKCTTLEEMHLSHNRFTEHGVEILVKASEEARADSKCPMWLRLEQNEVKNAEKVLADLKDRHSVCVRKNANKCSNRSCYHNCKVHLPHFFYQRGEDGIPNNDGPRKRSWEESRRDDSWQDDKWQNRGGYKKGGGSNWEEEPPRKKWRADDGGDWDRGMPAAEEPEPHRPQGVKMTGGIFMRAMGAVVTKNDGEEDAEEGRPARQAESPPPQNRTPKSLPNNVASRLLGGLGVLGGAPKRRNKVVLSEAPKRSGVKAEPDEEMDEEEDEKEADAEEEEEDEEEAEEEPTKERSRRGKDREERPRRDERGGMRSDRMEERETTRRRPSPARYEPRERRAEGRRGGGRDETRRSLPRRHQGGRGGRHEETSRRHASDRGGDRRGGDRERRRVEGGRREERERSQRPERQRDGDRRDRRRRDGGEAAERPERGEERRRRKGGEDERETERETERKDRPRQRASGDKPDTARLAAADRTEMLLEKIQGSRRLRKSQAEASEKPLTKQEPVESSRNPPPLVATRAKAAPRRPSAGSTPAPASTAASAPRPKARASTTVAAASKPAATKAAAKPAAQEVDDDNKSEYTYTDASEYTYEEIEEEAEEEVEEVEEVEEAVEEESEESSDDA